MNQLKAGAALSYISVILHIVVGLAYTPYMLRMLGQSEFGLYSLAASVVAYLTVLDLGFGNAIVRYTAKFRAEGKQREQEEMFGMFFILYIGIGVIALVAGALLALNVENLFNRHMTAVEVERTRIMMWLLTFNLAFTFPMSLWGSIMTAYERFVFQRTIAVLRTIANPLVMVVLLAVGYKAVAMVVVTTLFNVATLLINFWYCKRKLHIRLHFGRFKWGFLKEVSVYSFWIFLNVIMDRIYWSTGQFVLGMVRGTVAVAVYALAVQLHGMFQMFSTAISGVFLPRITSLVTKGQNEKAISDIFIKTGRIQYVVMAFILSAFIVFGQEFIIIWAGKDYAEAYPICLLFFIPLTVPLIQNLGIVILQARNQMRFRSTVYIIIALASFVLSFPLAIYWGGIGCAAATAAALVAGQIIVMNIYYYRKQFIDIPCFWREIGKMTIVPALTVVVSMCAIRYFDLSITSYHTLILYGLLYAALYIPAFWKLSMNTSERELFIKPVRKLLHRR